MADNVHNPVGCKRADTLVVKSRAWSSRCCGLSSVLYLGWEATLNHEGRKRYDMKHLFFLHYSMHEAHIQGSGKKTEHFPSSLPSKDPNHAREFSTVVFSRWLNSSA